MWALCAKLAIYDHKEQIAGSSVTEKDSIHASKNIYINKPTVNNKSVNKLKKLLLETGRDE